MADKVYPRPLGGPEPSPLGDSRPLKDSDASLNPGYDYSSSIPGVSRSEVGQGYCSRERITDAGSDGMDPV
jgi:hypothetical protein